MGNTNLARRHPDFPVSLGGEFLKRVQTADIGQNTPLASVDELGNFSAAGVSQDPTQYTMSLRWFPIDNQIEALTCGFAGSSGSTLNLNLMTNNPGIEFKTPTATMGTCRITSGQYSVQAPNGEFQATFNYKGGSYADATNVITATAPTGVGAYKSQHVSVQVEGGAVAVRASGVSCRFDIANQELYELNNAAMVGVALDAPKVSADIDFYESDLIAGNVSPALADPKDITIIVSTAKKIVLKRMVGGTQSQRGTVRGWATRRYSYQGAGDLTTLGLEISTP